MRKYNHEAYKPHEALGMTLDEYQAAKAILELTIREELSQEGYCRSKVVESLEVMIMNHEDVRRFIVDRAIRFMVDEILRTGVFSE